MNNLEMWDKVSQPPANVLKTIGGGRLRGMTDISPIWRYQILTDIYGPCGMGWKFTIDKLWLEPGHGGEMFAFSMISLFINSGGQWSAAIPGIGGSKLIANESNGPHNNDEAYKMAVTDALSTACKMLGLAADVYMGRWDGSKYIDRDSSKPLKQDNKNKKTDMACPECGKSEAVIKGKEEYGGGWLCFDKKGGCGFKWQDEKKDSKESPKKNNPKPDKKQPTITTLKEQINSEMTAKGLTNTQKKAFYGYVLSNSDSGESVQWAADFKLHFHEYFDSFVRSEVYSRDEN